jgi:hypothetical protein
LQFAYVLKSSENVKPVAKEAGSVKMEVGKVEKEDGTLSV